MQIIDLSSNTLLTSVVHHIHVTPCSISSRDTLGNLLWNFAFQVTLFSRKILIHAVW